MPLHCEKPWRLCNATKKQERAVCFKWLIQNHVLHYHPFVTLLSQRAQYGRWSSFGKRVWFTESHIVLTIVFSLMFYLLNLFLIWNNGVLYPVKQLDHFQETDTVTFLYSHLHTTLVRNWLPYWTASVRYQLLTFSHLNLSPSSYRQLSQI